MTVRALRMMMLRVFFDANRIRLHTGLPHTHFFNTPFFPSSSSLASLAAATTPLALGLCIPVKRGTARTRPGMALRLASSTWLERLTAAAPPGCSHGAQDAGARKDAMFNTTLRT
jgi:hypothetical protein